MPSAPLPLLYRDDHLVVVDKPSGMVVHRGWANDREVAMAVVRDQLGRRVFPVHRLDRGTSGCLLFALDADSARLLQRAFENGAVEKRYLALVRGVPPAEGVIDHPLRRAGGRPNAPRLAARTRFRRLAVCERYALVEAIPETGRLHQIRRHFKHLSHPLIGDVQYGKGEHNRLFRERYGLRRLALHALEIAFAHPVSGEPVRVTAPLPADLAAPLAAMGLWDGGAPADEARPERVIGRPGRSPADSALGDTLSVSDRSRCSL
jgi:tRNA pseudouridine65 synthase